MDKDYSIIDQRFIPFYLYGERVEVIIKEGYELYMGHGCRTGGTKLRFYVGLSTGWKPIFIMILNRNSTGGMAIMSEAIDHIQGLGIFHNDDSMSKMHRTNNFLNPFKEWQNDLKKEIVHSQITIR